MKACRSLPRLVMFLMVIVLFSIPGMLVTGCGSEQRIQDDPLFSHAAVLQYRVDSLSAENRRLIQQLDALASENRNLNALSADLEAKLKEARTLPPPPTAVADPSNAYSSALAQYRKRDFSGAMLQFESLLNGGVRNDLADNCHYWMGECLYGMGKYGDAIGHFETALGSPHSEKKDDSQLMIGNCQALMGNKSAARDSYNKVVSGFPASPYVRKAQEKLARLGG